MKELVDRKKLDDMLDKEALSSHAKRDRRGCAVLTVGHVKTLLVLCKLDPADLDKMNLAALGMWENFKKRLQGLIKQSKKSGWTEDERVGLGIQAIVRDLESAADLKVPEILAQAKAWEGIYATVKIDTEAWQQFDYYEMTKFLERAQAELATEKGENKP